MGVQADLAQQAASEFELECLVRALGGRDPQSLPSTPTSSITGLTDVDVPFIFFFGGVHPVQITGKRTVDEISTLKVILTRRGGRKWAAAYIDCGDPVLDGNDEALKNEARRWLAHAMS